MVRYVLGTAGKPIKCKKNPKKTNNHFCHLLSQREMKIEFCYINNALRAQQAEPVVVGGW